MNLSPMVLAIRSPAALPKGSVAPDPRKQEETRTFQKSLLMSNQNQSLNQERLLNH